MLIILRLLVAAVVLVFYLPVISGVAFAIIDAAGWLPGTLTNWWKDIGDMIAEVLDALARSGLEQDVQAEERVAEQVKRLVSRFPIYEG